MRSDLEELSAILIYALEASGDSEQAVLDVE
jgi:hypothetical protein